MPTITENWVFIIRSGESITPNPINRLLIRPLLLRIPIQAYTRIRNDVQDGNITNSSRISCKRPGARAMAYAIG